MTGQFLPEAMLPASSVFKKCCNYQCLIFVFDIETDGAPVSAPRTLCVIDCECTVCVLCAIQEGWHTQTTQSAFRSLVASGPCLSGGLADSRCSCGVHASGSSSSSTNARVCSEWTHARKNVIASACRCVIV